ncbi:MAG: ABC transporter substrate-binding protein [Caldilineaceae bacterium]|nr:ABC transporter substrate-binding protein [Caldilineaceae bacterium]
MGTTRSRRGEEEKKRRREEEKKNPFLPLSLLRFFYFPLSLFFLAACVSTRPVVKIGLIAPFEGIHRQSGYEALAAMRAAIDESETGDFAVMPLALDSGTEPDQARRTMQKLLVDPSVRAVVGPFLPESAAAVADLLDHRVDSWLLPFLPPSPVNREDALIALLTAIAHEDDSDEERPLVLAGWSTGWPDLSDTAWREQMGRPVRVSADPADVAPSETILWLGNEADGANYLIQLRSQGRDVPFWLAAGGEPLIFYQHVTHGLGMLFSRPSLGQIYWVAWLDDAYEGWAATHSPNSPTAYAVYRATQSAIAQISSAPSPSSLWRLYTFQLTEDGRSLPVNFTACAFVSCQP